jgi:hypothetical protein
VNWRRISKKYSEDRKSGKKGRKAAWIFANNLQELLV